MSQFDENAPLTFMGNLYTWGCCRCDHDIDAHQLTGPDGPCHAGGCTCPAYASGRDDEPSSPPGPVQS